MTRQCLDCEATLCAPRKNRPPTGYCVRCAPRHKWTSEARAKASASRKERWARELADPEKRAEAVASGQRLRERTPSTPDMVQKQIAGRRRNHWLPDGYEDLNRQLKKKGYLASERQELIAALQTREAERQRSAAAAAQTDKSIHERQLEKVRNGARVIPKIPLRKAGPVFTIGGIATGML